MHVRDCTRSLRSPTVDSRVEIDKDMTDLANNDGPANLLSQLTPKFKRNDGANNEIPLLSAEDLDLLMKISMKLDNPDALDGVQTIRLIRGFPSTSWHRTQQHEHEENWQEALLEYDISEQQKLASKTMHTIPTTPGSSSSKVMRSATFSVDSNTTIGTKHGIETESLQNVYEDRGRLKCLIELGQLHSALDQVISRKYPELLSSLCTTTYSPFFYL
jgi:hypothetical protein